jgi:hypothetical protein
MSRDETWAAMVVVADRLSTHYQNDRGLRVRTARRRQLSKFTVWEGLLAVDSQAEAFESVRYRRMLSSEWTDTQSVSDAAEGLQVYLRHWLP